MPISRRTFLQGTAAALAAPVIVRAQATDERTDLFRHGVASGDPLTTSVVLWTRVTPPATRSAVGPIEVNWQLSADELLTKPLARGSTAAMPGRDFTVKVEAGGLQPGRTYYFRFTAGGQRSPIGRTRTLGEEGVERARLAVVSCANYGTGYFNVYRCLANRPDLDAVVHLGDYIYETANGTFGDGSRPGRLAQRPGEAVSLADYRERYAVYRSDGDLQEVHRRHPFITVWDDHELADNAWSGGAAGHGPNEGSWAERQAAAYRAYLEWMPVRETPGRGIHLYRSFRIGPLADLVMLDTRGMRDRPRSGKSVLGGDQQDWLVQQLRESQRAGTRWRLIGQQVLFSSLNPPGSPVNEDYWEGYPAARKEVLDFLADDRVSNVAILTGDMHGSMAFDVPVDPWTGGRGADRPLAVEIVTPAISSVPFFADARVRAQMTAIKPRAGHMKFLDGERNGYVLLDVTAERLKADWQFVPTVEERSDRESTGASFVCENGSSRLTPA